MSSSHPRPVDSAAVPRFAGFSTFMRLPVAASAAGLDVALCGVPFDGGTTNRPGARHGPRAIREQSCLMRLAHHALRIAPYDSLAVADVGDVPANPIDLHDSVARIEAFFAEIRRHGAVPIAAGGDHLVTLPILRALGRGRPLGLVHFDAHSDTNDTYFGATP
jgi:guanidinopropionase